MNKLQFIRSIQQVLLVMAAARDISADHGGANISQGYVIGTANGNNVFVRYMVNFLSDGTAIGAHRNATRGLCDLTDRLTDGENFLWHEVKGVHDFHVWYLGFFNFAQIVFDKDYYK